MLQSMGCDVAALNTVQFSQFSHSLADKMIYANFQYR